MHQTPFDNRSAWVSQPGLHRQSAHLESQFEHGGDNIDGSRRIGMNLEKSRFMIDVRDLNLAC